MYLVHFRAFQAQDDRLFHSESAQALDQAESDDIASGDTSKDVHQHGLDIGVAIHQSEGGDHLFVGCLSSNVQEVGWGTVL